MSRVFLTVCNLISVEHPSAEKTVLCGSIPNDVQARCEVISKSVHILCHLVAALPVKSDLLIEESDMYK